MTLYYYVIFTIVTVVSYMMIVDRNIITYIELIYQSAIVQFKLAWWVVKLHPSNPISRWAFNRRIEQMTRELEEDLKNGRKHLTDDR